jgi:AraC-like DNA-binding protein
MRYNFWQPAADLAGLVGSYYVMSTPVGMTDFTRAEIPHLRFLLEGESTLQHGDESVTYRAPLALVCGPSLKAGNVAVSGGSTIVGASITPLGWQTIFGVPMRELSNRKAALDDFGPFDMAAFAERLAAASDDATMFGLVDAALRHLSRRQPKVNDAFLETALAWLLDPRSPRVDTLIDAAELSHRQVDRLCQTYFGAPPKRLHRVYRALNVAAQLAWTEETDWRQVASDQYYDQAHFIKDFKELIGCTPSTYVKGRNKMVRFDLMKRLEVKHQSLFSLIG